MDSYALFAKEFPQLSVTVFALLLSVEKMDKELLAFHIFLVLSLLFLGWASNEVYDEFSNKRIINGIYISHADDVYAARDVAKDWDSRGDFVCINVAYDMTPKEAVATCNHECIHKAFSEIWAENCEDGDFENCLEYLGGYNGKE